MSHVCPECNRANVRRASTPVGERTWRHNFYSRYRCRDCLHEFWVVRRKTYVAVATLLTAIVIAIIGVFVTGWMLNSD